MAARWLFVLLLCLRDIGSGLNIVKHHRRLSNRLACSQEEARLHWGGQDAAVSADCSTITEHGGTKSSRSGASQKAANIHIFGLFNTGTNLLQTVLHSAFPHASVCPDTKTHTKATGVRTCHASSMSKHAHPHFIKEWLANEPDAYAIFMVRDPFSNLLSDHKNGSGYGIAFCASGRQWLNTKCTCEADMRDPDPLCAPDQAEYTSIVQVWNTFTEGQLEIASSKSGPSAGRTLLVRYEDLVLKPDAVIKAVGAMVGATGEQVSGVMEHSSSRSHGNGRLVAMKQILERSYLSAFVDQDLQALCSQVNKTLASRLSYDDVSNSSICH